MPLSGEVAGGRNPWGCFTADNSFWCETPAASAGRRWTFPESNGGDDWYPLTPRRYYTSGNFQLGAGFCHTATISDDTPSSGRHFVYSKEWVHNFESHSRAHGHSVRCVRE